MHLFPGPLQEILRHPSVPNLGDAHDRRIALLHKLPQPGQLIPRQPHRVAHHLLVHLALELEHDLADGAARRPVIEAALALAHALVVARRVHRRVRHHPVVQPVLQPAQPPPDRVVRDLQLRRRDPPVVVLEPQPVVAEHQRRTLDGAAGADLRPPLERFPVLFHEFRLDPALQRRARGDGSGVVRNLRCDASAENGGEAWLGDEHEARYRGGAKPDVQHVLVRIDDGIVIFPAMVALCDGQLLFSVLPSQGVIWLLSCFTGAAMADTREACRLPRECQVGYSVVGSPEQLDAWSRARLLRVAS
nr:hypothetical protein CFP56_56515 [Quercus suber]